MLTDDQADDLRAPLPACLLVGRRLSEQHQVGVGDVVAGLRAVASDVPDAALVIDLAVRLLIEAMCRQQLAALELHRGHRGAARRLLDAPLVVTAAG